MKKMGGCCAPGRLSRQLCAGIQEERETLEEEGEEEEEDEEKEGE